MRRGFQNPVRRLLGPNIPPRLRQANRLLSAGKYAEAAEALEQLAHAAEARGGPRAPFFYIQAGRARVMAGQPEQGLKSMEQGLGLLATRGLKGRVASFGSSLIAELRQRDLKQEADELRRYLGTVSPGFIADKGPAASNRPPLPTHCPGCGAPVRPDEVEWLDQVTAECAFCGTPVRAG